MKIEKKVSEKTFNPISITITIESEKELRALDSVVNFDETIPGLVGNEGSEEYFAIQKLLEGIRRVL